MIHVHYLDGCAPTPLAHYLKALGILRLVAEQADPEARGWWDGDRFRLATTLGTKEIESFFLHDYQPTPLVSPWNKGAGFFNKKDPGLSPVQESKGGRFAVFRSGISASRERLDEIMPGMSAKERNRIKNSEDYKSQLREAEKEFKQLKSRLVADLQRSWRG